LSSTFWIATGTLVAASLPSMTLLAVESFALTCPLAVTSVISLVPVCGILARSAKFDLTDR